MKKIYFLVCSTLLYSTFFFGQQISTRVIDPTNCRAGESVEYCTTHKKMQELLKDPVERKKFEEYKALQKQDAQKVKNSAVEKGVIYKIPVVFHVLHNNGAENISREQILDGLAILNRDYKRLNADANTVSTPFSGLPVNIEVEFVLATKAPNGACFSGITRTVNVLTYDGADGGAQVDAIVAGNDVYQGQWSGSKYMNVFICKEIGGAAGYTTNPWSTNMQNGIWVLHNYVGSIGTSSVNTSRTLTHEAGHWLNLDHTWGPNNSPGDPTSCSIDDEVDDTPLCIGVSACFLTTNTCDDTNPASGTSSSWAFDVVDNVENYMDYSYCSKMFTQGQKDRMRTALGSNTGGRNNLYTTSNLNATGANGVLTLCKADFFTDKTVICAGDSISFTDDSYNAPTGWTWTTTGGLPASSAVQNPVIIYNTPGFYTVTLTATDGTTSDSETKTAVIQVLPSATSFPFYEGFESYTTLTGVNLWSVYDQNPTRAFSLFTGAGSSGSKCAKLTNFSETSTTSDELISSKIDLSSLTSSDIVTLSFRYAYKKKVSTNSESLKVLASGDCGNNWFVRKTISGSSLSALASTSAWTPTSVSDWTTVHVTTITASYFTSDFRFKFKFDASGGNNLYIDDINLYSGAPSDAIVYAGIAENNSTIGEIEVYPNPSDGEVNVHFTTPVDENVTIQIQDVTGKIAQNNLIKAKTGSNLVLLDTSKLSSGVYFIHMQFANTQKTIQFVVK